MEDAGRILQYNMHLHGGVYFLVAWLPYTDKTFWPRIPPNLPQSFQIPESSCVAFSFLLNIV